MPATKGKKKPTKKAPKKPAAKPKAAKKPATKPKAEKKPGKRAATKKPHGGEFSAAELDTIKAKVRHLRTEVIGPAAGTAEKLANAKRAIVDMERHLEGLERDRKEVRAFLRSSKSKVTKKQKPAGRRARRSR